MGRIVGLDFGTVRIGIAVSDERKILARPLGALQNKPDFFLQLQKLLKQEGVIEKAVIGLPLKLSGQDSPITQAARLFAKKLEETLQIPVILWDERLTSALVERSLTDAGVSRKKRAALSDTLSAVLILQSHLDLKGMV